MSPSLLSVLSPWWSKIAGAVLGAWLSGWQGLIVGLVLGHFLDQRFKLAPYSSRIWGARGDEAQRMLMTATFAVMGHLAKADGRVTKTEIATADAVMREFGLDGELRQRAIELFTRGKSASFPLPGVVRRLRARLKGSAELAERFMTYQLRLAFADGKPSPEQQRLQVIIGRLLKLPSARFEVLLARFSRQRDRRGPRQVKPNPQSAYAVLGIGERANEEEIKRAYRRAISKHHPDRLLARGASEQEVREAAQRTQEIRSAYEYLRRVRGF